MMVSITSFCTTYMKQCSTCDHPLAAVGVVAQTPRDVAANFYLHTRLVEVDVAVTAQFKAHHVLHDPVKPLRSRTRRYAGQRRFVR